MDQSPPTNVHTAPHMEMVSLKVIITDREFLRSTKYIQLETNKNKMHTKCRDGRHECRLEAQAVVPWCKGRRKGREAGGRRKPSVVSVGPKVNKSVNQLIIHLNS